MPTQRITEEKLLDLMRPHVQQQAEQQRAQEEAPVRLKTGVMCTTHVLVWHSQALHTNFLFQQEHTVGPQITSFRYNVEMPKEPNSRLYQLVCGKTGNIIHPFAYSSTTY